MADELISRQKIIKLLELLARLEDDFRQSVILGVVHTIKHAPAVDAVEVVRCKDCVRCGFCGEATNLEVMGFYGYCSRGKRREENAP